MNKNITFKLISDLPNPYIIYEPNFNEYVRLKQRQDSKLTTFRSFSSGLLALLFLLFAHTILFLNIMVLLSLTVFNALVIYLILGFTIHIPYSVMSFNGIKKSAENFFGDIINSFYNLLKSRNQDYCRYNVLRDTYYLKEYALKQALETKLNTPDQLSVFLNNSDNSNLKYLYDFNRRSNSYKLSRFLNNYEKNKSSGAKSAVNETKSTNFNETNPIYNADSIDLKSKNRVADENDHNILEQLPNPKVIYEPEFEEYKNLKRGFDKADTKLKKRFSNFLTWFTLCIIHVFSFLFILYFKDFVWNDSLDLYTIVFPLFLLPISFLVNPFFKKTSIPIIVKLKSWYSDKRLAKLNNFRRYSELSKMFEPKLIALNSALNEIFSNTKLISHHLTHLDKQSIKYLEDVVDKMFSFKLYVFLSKYRDNISNSKENTKVNETNEGIKGGLNKNTQLWETKPLIGDDSNNTSSENYKNDGNLTNYEGDKMNFGANQSSDIDLIEKNKKSFEIENNKQSKKNLPIRKQVRKLLERNLPLNRNPKKEQINQILNPVIKGIHIRVPDWLEINRKKMEIGLIGEISVVEHEKRKLQSQNLEHLANKVEHVSQTQGDGLGYDIVSYNQSGEKIYIEVKSTSSKSHTIFFTANELEVMKTLDQRYYLYRVYRLGENTNHAVVNIFKGCQNIMSNFDFEADTYKGTVGKNSLNYRPSNQNRI